MGHMAYCVVLSSVETAFFGFVTVVILVNSGITHCSNELGCPNIVKLHVGHPRGLLEHNLLGWNLGFVYHFSIKRPHPVDASLLMSNTRFMCHATLIAGMGSA